MLSPVRIETRQSAVEMARPLMVRFLGGPLRLNERAADDIFSGWISPSRYEPATNVEKTFKIFLN